MNKKIKYLIVLLLLVFPLVLTGCFGSSDSDTPEEEDGSKIIELTPQSISLNVGDEQSFEVVVQDETGNVMDTKVQWALVDDTIGTLSSTTGSTVTFTADKLGSTKVKVTAEGLTASADIEVSNKTIELTPQSVSVNIGDEQAFEVIVKGGDGNVMDTEVQWSLADDTIGTLSSTTGSIVTLTGDKSGSTTLTATAEGLTATATVEVLEALTGPTATVTGYVTNGRGGPKIADAMVSYDNRSAITNTDGYFELEIPADTTADVVVEVDGTKRTKVQDVTASEDQKLEFEIPVKEEFNPDWPVEPSQIDLSIEAGAELSGTEDIEVTITGDNEIYITYVYLGGEQRYPRDGYGIDDTTFTTSIDTTAYPNGESYLKVLSYDKNENATLYIIPVTINNTVDDSTSPGDLAKLNLEATTNVNDFVYYNITSSNNTSSIQSYNQESSSPSRVSVKLTWEPVEGADGYRVSRSFDGSNYDLIGNIKASETRFDDFSAELAPDKEVYYKVAPYNSFGDGAAIERAVTPLPAYKVYLETPAHDSTGVSLTPTFTWKSEETFAEGVEFYFEFKLYDGEGILVESSEIKDGVETYTLSTILDPANLYTWDITSAEASIEYYYDTDGYSYAISSSGSQTDGCSMNGQFMFTTTTDTGSN